MVRTRYGGSEAMPHTPTEADPRSVVARSRLEEDPRLKTMWAGYAFSEDYPRGARPRLHAGGSDLHRAPGVQRRRARASTATRRSYTTYLKLGDGDLIKGFEQLQPDAYAEARKHGEASGGLHRLPRSEDDAAAHHAPGFIEGIRALKASQGVQNYDVEHDGHAAGDALLSCAASATSSTTSRARRSA